MASPFSPGCQHPEVCHLDGLSCCFSCGLTISSPTPSLASDDLVSDNIDSPSIESPGNESIYQTLNYDTGQEIRLLQLQPGEFSEELECEIVHAHLLDKPQYEAVSYTWANEDGDDTLKCHIKCVGSDSIINITANCEAALRRIRRPTATRVIWLDSICIDQSSITERNHQVRQMGNIYASAEQVIIYLGEELASSKEVFRYLSKAIITKGNTSFKVTFPPNRYLPSQKAINKFLSRRWFHRVWVLQEAGLARRATVICGNQSLDWFLFSADRFSQAGLSTQTAGDVTPGVLLLETSFYKQKPGMIDLLHAGRSSLCSDPRDKVFALLGLVDADEATKIQIDYGQTVEWLFTHVAVELIKSGSKLDILAHVRSGTRYMDLPSWVPDWTLSMQEDPIRNQFSEAELAFMSAWTFTASWNVVASSSKEITNEETLKAQARERNLSIISMNEAQPFPQNDLSSFQRRESRQKDDQISYQLYRPRVDPDPHILRSLPTRLVVRAHQIATITSKLRYSPHDCTTCSGYPCAHPSHRPVLITSSPQCGGVLEFWSHVLEHPLVPRRTVAIDASIPPAFGSHALCPSCGPHKTSCRVSWGDEEGSPGEFTYELDCEEAQDRLIGRRPHCNARSSHYSKSAFASAMGQKNSYARGRVLFRTRESLGLGPMSLRGDEEVWLLDNCRVALALKKVEKHYKVLGDCYVYGALNARHPCPVCERGIQCAEPVKTEVIEIW